MSLSTYKNKRNFNQTSEPKPEISKKAGAKSFVIQRHNASRLHYDFRLEVNGVLKSWAVPKGPSLNPTDKRLAMMVEDHPLSYGSFKGVIPEGNYGAGIVEIWDNGTYEPEEMEKISDAAIERNIKSGMLKFSLKGKKLKGSFALVRIRGAESKNWLLIKHRDKYAVEDAYNSEDDTPENSPINKQLRSEKESDGGGSSNKKSASKTQSKTPAKRLNSTKTPVKGSGSTKTAAKQAGSTKTAAKQAGSNKTSIKKSASKNAPRPVSSTDKGKDVKKK